MMQSWTPCLPPPLPLITAPAPCAANTAPGGNRQCPRPPCAISSYFAPAPDAMPAPRWTRRPRIRQRRCTALPKIGFTPGPPTRQPGPTAGRGWWNPLPPTPRWTRCGKCGNPAPARAAAIRWGRRRARMGTRHGCDGAGNARQRDGAGPLRNAGAHPAAAGCANANGGPVGRVGQRGPRPACGNAPDAAARAGACPGFQCRAFARYAARRIRMDGANRVDDAPAPAVDNRGVQRGPDAIVLSYNGPRRPPDYRINIPNYAPWGCWRAVTYTPIAYKVYRGTLLGMAIGLDICGARNRAGRPCRRPAPCVYHAAAPAGWTPDAPDVQPAPDGGCPHCGAGRIAIAGESWMGLALLLCRVCGWRGSGLTAAQVCGKSAQVTITDDVRTKM